MLQITAKNLKSLDFRPYRKTALLSARPLTEDDYRQRTGVIQTLEGPVQFQPGDYLARGIKNEEWPIRRQRFAELYEQVGKADASNFGTYRAIGVRQAAQLQEPFTVEIDQGDTLTGNAGDYLVVSDGSGYVAERNIFESTYEPVVESQQRTGDQANP